jgi:hypothetical protein
MLGNTYASIEILALPDTAFEYSEAEAVLLIACGEKRDKVNLTVGEVSKKGLKTFLTTHKPSYSDSADIQTSANMFDNYIWIPRLGEVWEATKNLRTLSEWVEIHRGVEYRFSLKEFPDRAVSSIERPDFVRGLHLVGQSLEPFTIPHHVYINVSPSDMRTDAYKYEWDKPKVIINAQRRTRGPWKLTAAPDYSGLYCVHYFDGVWPKADVNLEVIAAILNSPLANAFMSLSDSGWDLRISTMYRIPVPNVNKEQKDIISSLVQEYQQTRKLWLNGVQDATKSHSSCKEIMQLIDAEVLKAYDLSPRLERMLLDFFAGFQRPGPVEFLRYYPEGFQAHIPWHIYISKDFQSANVKETLGRLKLINDPSISKMLSSLEDGADD